MFIEKLRGEGVPRGFLWYIGALSFRDWRYGSLQIYTMYSFRFTQLRQRGVPIDVT